MKVFIAIPCLDMIDVDFVKSLVDLNTKGLEVSINFLAGSLVYVAREDLTKAAIESGADYVLWLDSDMVFPAETLIDMIRDDVDIVSGLCFRRKTPYTPTIYKKIRIGITENEVEEYNDYPYDKLFNVEGVGGACLLVKTKVLKECIDNFNACWLPLKCFGEDISFCIRARKLGYTVYCDSRIKIGHIGKAIVDEETWKGIKKNAKHNR